MYSSLRRVSEYFYPIHLSVNNTSTIMDMGKYQIPHCLEVSYINKKFVHHKIEYLKKNNDHLNKPNIKKKTIQTPKCFFEI